MIAGNSVAASYRAKGYKCCALKEMRGSRMLASRALVRAAGIDGPHSALEFNAMTTEAKHIVDGFQALPDTAKREVLAELVRISGRIDYPTVSDDELLSAANDVFLSYDERESE
jgi:hypothetical protein